MTKQEAIKAMSEGKKVTHENFSSNEWMTIDRNQILLEDGVKCSPYEFWRWRTSESWNDGYSIFTEKKHDKQLKDLEIGHAVWCGGDSGFCDSGIEKVENITFKFDDETGEKYKVIHLSNDRLFDSRDGYALTPPTAYYLKIV